MSTSMLTSPIELLRKDIEEGAFSLMPEDCYSDEFYQELLDYGIESVEQFEDAYHGEYSSGAEFAEQLCNDCGYLEESSLPTFIITHIDWEAVWSRELCFDYFMIKANTGYAFFTSNF